MTGPARPAAEDLLRSTREARRREAERLRREQTRLWRTRVKLALAMGFLAGVMLTAVTYELSTALS